jgi:hypothetical protein
LGKLTADPSGPISVWPRFSAVGQRAAPLRDRSHANSRAHTRAEIARLNPERECHGVDVSNRGRPRCRVGRGDEEKLQPILTSQCSKRSRGKFNSKWAVDDFTNCESDSQSKIGG